MDGCMAGWKKNRNWCIWELMARISHNPLTWPLWFALNYVFNPFKRIFSCQQKCLLPRCNHGCPGDKHRDLNTWRMHCARKSRPGVCQRSNTYPQCCPAGCEIEVWRGCSHLQHELTPITLCKEVLMDWCKQEIFAGCQQCCWTCLVKPKFGLMLVLRIL